MLLLLLFSSSQFEIFRRSGYGSSSAEKIMIATATMRMSLYANRLWTIDVQTKKYLSIIQLGSSKKMVPSKDSLFLPILQHQKSFRFSRGFDKVNKGEGAFYRLFPTVNCSSSSSSFYWFLIRFYNLVHDSNLILKSSIHHAPTWNKIFVTDLLIPEHKYLQGLKKIILMPF